MKIIGKLDSEKLVKVRGSQSPMSWVLPVKYGARSFEVAPHCSDLSSHWLNI